jgi:valyl-tRNA synthetase
MNQTESTGSVSLRDFFSHHGKPVKNLNDFWGWKADQITEDLKDMLKELKDFISEIRQNKNANQTEMAGKLSGPLKKFASKNGIDPSNASLEDLAKLEKLLQDKIIELLKLHAARLVDQSQDDKPTATASVTADKKEASLTEPTFQTKIIQELLNPSKNITDTTTNALKTTATYSDSAINLQDSSVETYA